MESQKAKSAAELWTNLANILVLDAFNPSVTDPLFLAFLVSSSPQPVKAPAIPLPITKNSIKSYNNYLKLDR